MLWIFAIQLFGLESGLLLSLYSMKRHSPSRTSSWAVQIKAKCKQQQEKNKNTRNCTALASVQRYKPTPTIINKTCQNRTMHEKNDPCTIKMILGCKERSCWTIAPVRVRAVEHWRRSASLHVPLPQAPPSSSHSRSESILSFIPSIIIIQPKIKLHVLQ